MAQSTTPGLGSLLSYTTSNMAQDALALVNHLGWEQFHVMGVSMGGMITLELAQIVPQERILSLTLMVTHAGGWGGRAPWEGIRLTLHSLFFAKDNESRLATIMKTLYTDASLQDEKLAERLKQHHVRRLAARVPPAPAAILGHTLAVYRHYVSYTNLLRIRYASYPTLVVVGSDDKLVRIENSSMLSTVLGARLFVVPNGGHGLLAEYPELINKEIEAFVQSAVAQRKAREQDKRKSPDEEEREAGEDDFAVESQEVLMGGEGGGGNGGDAEGQYTLEEQALSLACSHSVHCSMHNLSGFITGFVPAFVFRYIFFDSIALTAGVSRWDQSVRFGLLIGMVRAGIRGIRCMLHAWKARQWMIKHKLIQPSTTAKNTASESQSRRGIPAQAGFDVPIHSVLMLIAFGVITWKKELLTGVFG